MTRPGLRHYVSFLNYNALDKIDWNFGKSKVLETYEHLIPARKNGANGKNADGIVYPTSRKFINVSFIINDYKSYVREHLPNNPRASDLKSFLDEMERDELFILINRTEQFGKTNENTTKLNTLCGAENGTNSHKYKEIELPVDRVNTEIKPEMVQIWHAVSDQIIKLFNDIARRLEDKEQKMNDSTVITENQNQLKHSSASQIGMSAVAMAVSLFGLIDPISAVFGAIIAAIARANEY